MGPVSNASARSPSSPSAVAASTVSSARAAGSSTSDPLAAGAATGTPAAANTRGNRAPARGTDRTMTAICDHGTPSMRWARRSASAIMRRLRVRRRGQAHRDRTVLGAGAVDVPAAAAAGQSATRCR